MIELFEKFSGKDGILSFGNHTSMIHKEQVVRFFDDGKFRDSWFMHCLCDPYLSCVRGMHVGNISCGFSTLIWKKLDIIEQN